MPLRVACVIATIALQSPAIEPKPDLHVVVSLLATRALEEPVAGLSIAVARRGEIIDSRGFGFADLDDKIPVTPATVFHIASISKHILAAAVLQLVEAGTLSLDADITTYVPEAPTHGRRVTLRQLLSHTSGLFDYTDVADAEANEARDLSHADVLALIKDRPASFAPGTGWRYSNTGPYLAGMAIEHVTGLSYAAYLRDRVFTPLGMTSASLCTSHDNVARLAHGYVVRDGRLVPAAPATWTTPFAAGGVCATAADLVRWEAALDSGRLISRRSVELMRTATTLVDGTRIDYGLGTRLGSLQGHAIVGHTGSGNGFNAELASLPNDGLTIAVLSNTGSARAGILAAAMARSALELAPAALKGSVVPAAERDALTGRFDAEDGPIETFPCGAELCFRPVGAPQGRAMLRQSPFAYLADADTEIRFQRPPGPVEWAMVYSGGLFAQAARRLH